MAILLSPTNTENISNALAFLLKVVGELESISNVSAGLSTERKFKLSQKDLSSKTYLLLEKSYS